MKKGRILILSAFVAFGAFWSCSNVKETTNNEMNISGFNIGDTAEIALGDIVLCNDDIKLFVKFDSVLTDSRCPLKANCIWEGNAEAGFSITYNKELEKVKLNTSQKMGTKKSAYGFDFELLSLNPYPGSENYDTAKRTVKIKVTKSE